MSFFISSEVSRPPLPVLSAVTKASTGKACGLVPVMAMARSLAAKMALKCSSGLKTSAPPTSLAATCNLASAWRTAAASNWPRTITAAKPLLGPKSAELPRVMLSTRTSPIISATTVTALVMSSLIWSLLGLPMAAAGIFSMRASTDVGAKPGATCMTMRQSAGRSQRSVFFCSGVAPTVASGLPSIWAIARAAYSATNISFASFSGRSAGSASGFFSSPRVRIRRRMAFAFDAAEMSVMSVLTREETSGSGISAACSSWGMTLSPSCTIFLLAPARTWPSGEASCLISSEMSWAALVFSSPLIICTFMTTPLDFQ